MSDKTKKVYSVYLETENEMQETYDQFWMYRGFGYDKDKAIQAARILLQFYPAAEFPTKVMVYEENEQPDGYLTDKKELLAINLKFDFDETQK